MTKQEYRIIVHLMSEGNGRFTRGEHGSLFLHDPRAAGKRPDSSAISVITQQQKGKVPPEQVAIRQGKNLQTALHDIESGGSFRYTGLARRATNGDVAASGRLAAILGRFGAKQVIDALNPKEE